LKRSVGYAAPFGTSPASSDSTLHFAPRRACAAALMQHAVLAIQLAHEWLDVPTLGRLAWAAAAFPAPDATALAQQRLLFADYHVASLPGGLGVPTHGSAALAFAVAARALWERVRWALQTARGAFIACPGMADSAVATADVLGLGMSTLTDRTARFAAGIPDDVPDANALDDWLAARGLAGRPRSLRGPQPPRHDRRLAGAGPCRDVVLPRAGTWRYRLFFPEADDEGAVALLQVASLGFYFVITFVELALLGPP
ncbi:unnamed protein product, partial [Durusdinium trenchii]